ncbi:MAG: hypothetical protein JWN83_2783 [Chitinophagaceae bacterium]|jgi:hypothetical protein|nr:hypothetical protein [Chitinophagaceae bacterium]
MRKLLAILLVVLLAFGAWWIFFKDKSHNGGPKQQPLKVGKHSAEFNQSVGAVITAYLSLKEAFVNADTAKIKDQEKKLIAAIDSIKIDELKKDTTGIFQSAQLLIGDIKSNADAIVKETDITEMRQDFRMISENLFPLLKTIHYEGEKLYWQNCPMAFGEGKDASWISNTEEILNPYLGKNHPEYKGTMLHCGEIKDTIQ